MRFSWKTSSTSEPPLNAAKVSSAPDFCDSTIVATWPELPGAAGTDTDLAGIGPGTVDELGQRLPGRAFGHHQ